MTPRPPAIHARGLTRYFGAEPAVSGLDLHVPQGCVFGFLGRNGSGKTTTIRMLLGLLHPTRGHSALLDCDSRRLSPAIRARIGYMTEEHRVVEHLTVKQNCAFQSAFYPRWNQQAFDAIADQFQLRQEQHARSLSRGQRAGLALALTLAPEPDLLILDDPALGLDPVARRALIEAMLHATRSRERTIFFSSHLIDDVERVADEIAILDDSLLRACCPVDEFRDQVRRYQVQFSRAWDVPAFAAQLPGLLNADPVGTGWRLTVAGREEIVRTQLTALHAESIESAPLPLEEAVVSFLGNPRRNALFSQTTKE